MARRVKTLVVFGSVEQDAELQQLKVGSQTNVLSFNDDLLVISSDDEESKEERKFTRPTKSDIYLMSYTSGTTGDPKGVKISHEKIMVNARMGDKTSSFH